MLKGNILGLSMMKRLDIDTEHFKDICCQQSDIAKSLLEQIKVDLPELTASLESSDPGQLLFSAHRFLGIGRYCGIAQLVDICLKIETEEEIDDGNLAELKRAAHLLDQWLDDIDPWVYSTFELS